MENVARIRFWPLHRFAACNIFDADGDVTNAEHRKKHESENKALFTALGVKSDPFPKAIVWGKDHAVWPEKIEIEVKACFKTTEYDEIANDARKAIDPGASLAKNPVLIGEILSVSWERGKKPKTLVELIGRLTKFADS